MDGRRQHKEVASELFRRLVHEFRDLHDCRAIKPAFDCCHPHGRFRHIHHASGHFRHHLGHVFEGRRMGLHLGSDGIHVKLFRSNPELVQHLVGHKD